MIELKKCPFCGGEATIDNAGGKYQAWCKHCCCIHMGEFYNTESEAIAAWSRRAQPENEPLTKEQNKQLLHEVCKLAVESVKRDVALAKLEAEVVAARNAVAWIPVTERLPEYHVNVLTCDCKGNIHIMSRYENEKKPFGVDRYHSRFYMVRYWMPLPAVPRGGE